MSKHSWQCYQSIGEIFDLIDSHLKENDPFLENALNDQPFDPEWDTFFLIIEKSSNKVIKKDSYISYKRIF